MRYCLAFGLAILLNSVIQAQNLQNTTWVRTAVLNKNGAPLDDPNRVYSVNLAYQFKDTTAAIIYEHSVYAETGFTLGSTLDLGKFVKYKVNYVDQDSLVLLEEPRNRSAMLFVFCESGKYYRKLLETGMVKIVGDSLAECNRLFSPVCAISPFELFPPLGFLSGRKLFGELILTSSGTVKEVNILTGPGFSDKNKGKVIEIWKSTSGKWLMPDIQRKLGYKIYFSLEANSFSGTMARTIFSMHESPALNISVSLRDRSESQRRLRLGLKLVKEEKYEIALDRFLEAFKLDPDNADAAYNAAALYAQLGNKKSACEIWNKLRSNGDLGAKDLYERNCN